MAQLVYGWYEGCKRGDQWSLVRGLGSCGVQQLETGFHFTDSVGCEFYAHEGRDWLRLGFVHGWCRGCDAIGLLVGCGFCWRWWGWLRRIPGWK